MGFLFTLWQDVKYGARLLGRTPVLTLVAVLTLGLGIGANTAIFSVIDAVAFRSLPVQHAEQLFVPRWIANKRPSHLHGMSSYGDTQENFRDVNPTGSSFSRVFFEQVSKSEFFSDVAGFANAGPITISGNGPASSIRGQSVTGNFFSTLGIHPAAGRLLGPADDNFSAPPALVLNYLYWQKAFGGSPSAVGKVVKINNVPFTIVGVAEPRFVALSFGNMYDVWLPMSFQPVTFPRFRNRYNDPLSWWMLMIARLKPGVSAVQAQSAMDVLFRNFTLHAGDKPMFSDDSNQKLQLVPAQKALVGESPRYADPLRVLMAAVGMVLLIACANVAGLVLARATARRREIAVRLALGAWRVRLLRQLLTESVLLAVMGGGLGILVAFWGARALVRMIGSMQFTPLGFSATLDGRVLAFTAAISLLTGILFGLAPAFRSLHLDLTPALRGASQSTAAQPERRRWLSSGNALVVLQAALAMVVLMGAGLLVRTLANLKNVDPGFDTRNLLTFNLEPSLAGYKPAQIDNLYRDLDQRIAAMPGVIAVSYSESALLAGSWSRTGFRYVPPNSSKRVEVEADYMPVSPDFFSTLKIPMLSGRNFSALDYKVSADEDAFELAQRDARNGGPQPEMPSTPVPALINSLFAKKYFPGMNPIGQRFGAEDGSDSERPKNPGYEVIGIVGDAKYNSLRRDIDPTMYVPLTGSSADFEVRTAGDPRSFISSIRDVIDQRDSNLPMIRVATQSEQIEMRLAAERIVAQLSSFFGVVALILACMGLYGLLSYEVTRKTREIGIRMALGASRSDLVRMVVSQGLILAVIGTSAGLAAALGIGHLMTKLLYGVKPADPITLIAVTVLLMFIAAVAALVPARRATTVDPVIALRYE
ncbi:MAG: ABC transporter permease [Acidobacteria bacterium]|nr:ABC transporter permease [Acidobacteriota bacterium]